MLIISGALDETTSGETMALRVIEYINSRLNFLYGKNWFVDVSLRRLLCNALIQAHFDYAYTAWYPNLTRWASSYAKQIRFSLKLNRREHISNKHFQRRNWLKFQTMSHQLNYPFRKTYLYQTSIWSKIPQNWKKTRTFTYFNICISLTQSYKILVDLIVLVIIKILFIFIKYFYIFFLLPSI